MTADHHRSLELLSYDECTEALRSSHIGRIAFVADGAVAILPVHYRWHHGSVVFRSAAGAKVHAALEEQTVGFEIDGWDEATRTGWSVLVDGAAHEVLDEAEQRELAELGLTVWIDGPERDRWVRVRADGVSGRRIH